MEDLNKNKSFKAKIIIVVLVVIVLAIAFEIPTRMKIVFKFGIGRCKEGRVISISQMHNEQLCEICNKKEVKSSGPPFRIICDDCAQHFHRCAYCGKRK
jgi:hypothetical protein